jgi:hypothetical protein
MHSLPAEILREISKCLGNSKLTILAFALCCQRHRFAGLDTLWSTMTSLNPLIKLVSMYHFFFLLTTLFHNSQVENMTVRDQYAFRIIHLTINPAQNLPLFSAAQFQEIEEKKAGLLPNLRELRLSWSLVRTPGRRCSVLLPSILRGSGIVSICETIPAGFPHHATNCLSSLCIGVGRSIHQLSLQGDLPHNVSSLQTLIQLKTFSLSNTTKLSVSPFSLLTALSTIQGLRSLSLSLDEDRSEDPEAPLAFQDLTTISLSSSLPLVCRLLRVLDGRSLDTVLVTTVKGDDNSKALQELFSALGDLKTISCLTYSAVPRSRLPLAVSELASAIIQGIYSLQLHSLSLSTRFPFTDPDIEVLTSAFPTLSSLAIFHRTHPTLTQNAPTLEALGCIADCCLGLRDLAITLEIDS